MAKEIKFYKAENPFGCFSNYSDHSIFLEEESWKTAEHYYQAQKFRDFEIQKRIQKAETPKEASKIGRSYPEKVREDWSEIKDDVMEKVIRTKVDQHEDIKKELIKTRNALIIEDSPVDYYWGCGEDETGLNKLGKIWMKIRRKSVI